jgi:hypothetical protein
MRCHRKMKLNRLGLAVAVTVACLAIEDVAPASAEDLVVFAPGLVGGGLNKLAEDWGRETGNTVRIQGGTLVAVAKAASSQPGDLLILPVGEMPKHASGFRGADISIGRVLFTLAVVKGAPKPDISTEAAFRASLKGQAVAYNDPAGGSIAGVMIEKVLADPLYADVKKVPVAGNAALKIGTAAPMAIGVLSEQMRATNAEIAGVLPQSLGLSIDFSGAVLARSPHGDLAAALLAYLVSGKARAVWKENGIEPLFP